MIDVIVILVVTESWFPGIISIPGGWGAPGKGVQSSPPVESRPSARDNRRRVRNTLDPLSPLLVEALGANPHKSNPTMGGPCLESSCDDESKFPREELFLPGLSPKTTTGGRGFFPGSVRRLPQAEEKVVA